MTGADNAAGADILLPLFETLLLRKSSHLGVAEAALGARSYLGVPSGAPIRGEAMAMVKAVGAVGPVRRAVSPAAGRGVCDFCHRGGPPVL